MKNRYTITWDHSPTIEKSAQIVAEDYAIFAQNSKMDDSAKLEEIDFGRLAYLVSVSTAKPDPDKEGEFLPQESRMPSLVWPFHNTIEVEAEVGSAVRVMVAARSFEGAVSAAQVIEFLADDLAIPAPPGHLYVSKVQHEAKESQPADGLTPLTIDNKPLVS